MLLKKNDSNLYVAEFKKRFENFCSKAPLLMSYTTSPAFVQIVDETSDEVFDIPFDFSIPVKTFIYGIKQLLINNGCYPVIEFEEKVEIPLTKAEQIELASTGTSVDKIPTARTETKLKRFMFEKVIVYRDIFILKDLDTQDSYRYQLRRSSTVFLKKLRTKEKTPLESGKYFFANAMLLNKIVLKEDFENETGQE